jgi:putative addiction module component (TIGR02574 family)
MDGLHRQRVPQHKGDAVLGAEVGEPVPGEHALRAHDEIVAKGGHGLEERVRCGLQVAMHQHLAGPVEDADVHRLHVEIRRRSSAGAAECRISSVLLLRDLRGLSCAKTYSRSRGLYEHQAAAPDGTGARSRVPLALGATVDSRVPQVSGKTLARQNAEATRKARIERAMGSGKLPVPPPGFDDLEVGEQIDYVQALWDQIAAKGDRVPVPDWHRDVLDERLADLEANPEDGRPWADVRADLLKRSRKG